MPVCYDSIVAEHEATRNAVGFFDISHMGRFQFTGPEAGTWLERLLTRRVDDMSPGQIRYSLLTHDEGGILDDVLVYRCPPQAGHADEFLLVVNAGNRDKVWKWIQEHRPANTDAEMADRTHDWAMVAVQGPRSLEVVGQVVDFPLEKIGYFTCVQANIDDQHGLVSRTGYTGEDGVEAILPADIVEKWWQELHTTARELGGQPAGLGCRDTLRLEAAMPLYGHEIDMDTDPWQAGLGFAVDLENREFPGRNALACRKQETSQRRIGLELEGRRVPREGYAILDGEQAIGRVTSGTFSPTLQRPIAMGYVSKDYSDIGRTLAIDIRGQTIPATVVKLPFYHRRKNQGVKSVA